MQKSAPRKHGIPVGSLSYPSYLRSVADRLIAIERQISTAYASYSKSAKEGEYLLTYCARHPDNSVRPFPPDEYSLDIARRGGISSCAMAISTASETRLSLMRFSSIAGYVDRLEASLIDNEALDFVRELREHGNVRLNDYGYTEPVTFYKDDPEFNAFVRSRDALLSIERLSNEIRDIIADFRPNLEDLRLRCEYQHRPHEYKPPHGVVEPLFHASLFAGDLARNGFSSQKPVGRVGIGCLGDQAEISFTYDLNFARVVTNTFREIWLISNEFLRPADLIAQMRHEGIDPDKARYYFVSSDMKDGSPEHALAIYKAYLGLSKVAKNPLVVSGSEILSSARNTAFNEIGIIQADVSLKNPVIYNHGESEFVVCPEDVIGPVAVIEDMPEVTPLMAVACRRSSRPSEYAPTLSH